MSLTTQELNFIDQMLHFEQVVIKKYTLYSSICKDQQLKQKCEQIVAEHQSHYTRLLQQLN